MTDDVMMSLCRLTDQPRLRRFENASLRNLFEKIENELSPESKQKITDKLSMLSENLAQIKILRDKALSHTDLSYALNAELLPKPTYPELEGDPDSHRYSKRDYRATLGLQ